jgi:hypothetical protein
MSLSLKTIGTPYKSEGETCKKSAPSGQTGQAPIATVGMTQFIYILSGQGQWPLDKFSQALI